jgi:hypothetical protein
MARKNKVEQSSNYNQILDWIGEGKSSRWISRELKNQFGESIGHVAISNYRKKNIVSEAIEIVDIQLKEEAKEKAAKEKESKKQEVIQTHVQNKKLQKEGDEKASGLAETTAKQYKGLLNVADNFEEDYYNMRNAVNDETSKVNEKDVAEMSFKALKLAHEISKDDTGMEETINTGFGELADAIKKSREALQD